jgi:hypothetical protein
MTKRMIYRDSFYGVTLYKINGIRKYYDMNKLANRQNYDDIVTYLNDNIAPLISELFCYPIFTSDMSDLDKFIKDHKINKKRMFQNTTSERIFIEVTQEYLYKCIPKKGKEYFTDCVGNIINVESIVFKYFRIILQYYLDEYICGCDIYKIEGI